ncbi:hypothetical protein CDD81_5573 [Ophiocordyceps australis]|uniref:Uncharacterized protein n=1 Tax=Ophiocordyceps australis TaxID=1399860 RepID=A0A2C5Y9Z4_9HYPO|nr:hypothetical protein CDD81_5573 [Ophiocordyceps australis]
MATAQVVAPAPVQAQRRCDLFHRGFSAELRARLRLIATAWLIDRRQAQFVPVCAPFPSPCCQALRLPRCSSKAPSPCEMSWELDDLNNFTDSEALASSRLPDGSLCLPVPRERGSESARPTASNSDLFTDPSTDVSVDWSSCKGIIEAKGRKKGKGSNNNHAFSTSGNRGNGGANDGGAAEQGSGDGDGGDNGHDSSANGAPGGGDASGDGNGDNNGEGDGDKDKDKDKDKQDNPEPDPDSEWGFQKAGKKNKKNRKGGANPESNTAEPAPTLPNIDSGSGDFDDIALTGDLSKTDSTSFDASAKTAFNAWSNNWATGTENAPSADGANGNQDEDSSDFWNTKSTKKKKKMNTFAFGSFANLGGDSNAVGQDSNKADSLDLNTVNPNSKIGKASPWDLLSTGAMPGENQSAWAHSFSGSEGQIIEEGQKAEGDLESINPLSNGNGEMSDPLADTNPQPAAAESTQADDDLWNMSTGKKNKKKKNKALTAAQEAASFSVPESKAPEPKPVQSNSPWALPMKNLHKDKKGVCDWGALSMIPQEDSTNDEPDNDKQLEAENEPQFEPENEPQKEPQTEPSAKDEQETDDWGFQASKKKKKKKAAEEVPKTEPEAKPALEVESTSIWGQIGKNGKSKKKLAAGKDAEIAWPVSEIPAEEKSSSNAWSFAFNTNSKKSNKSADEAHEEDQSGNGKGDNAWGPEVQAQDEQGGDDDYWKPDGIEEPGDESWVLLEKKEKTSKSDPIEVPDITTENYLGEANVSTWDQIDASDSKPDSQDKSSDKESNKKSKKDKEPKLSEKELKKLEREKKKAEKAEKQRLQKEAEEKAAEQARLDKEEARAKEEEEARARKEEEEEARAKKEEKEARAKKEEEDARLLEKEEKAAHAKEEEAESTEASNDAEAAEAAKIAKEEKEIATLLAKKAKRGGKLLKKDTERLMELNAAAERRAELRAAQEAEHLAAKEREEQAAKEAEEQAAKEAEEQAAREAEEQAAKEAEEQAAKEAAEQAVREAKANEEAKKSKKSSSKSKEREKERERERAKEREKQEKEKEEERQREKEREKQDKEKSKSKKKDKKAKEVDSMPLADETSTKSERELQSERQPEMEPKPGLEPEPEPELTAQEAEDLLSFQDNATANAFGFWGIGAGSKNAKKGSLSHALETGFLQPDESFDRPGFFASWDEPAVADKLTAGPASSKGTNAKDAKSTTRKPVGSKIADRLKAFEAGQKDIAEEPLGPPPPVPSPPREDEASARPVLKKKKAFAEEATPDSASSRKSRRSSELPGSFPADDEYDAAEAAKEAPHAHERHEKSRKKAVDQQDLLSLPVPPPVPDPPLSPLMEPRPSRKERPKVKEESWARWNAAPRKEEKKTSSRSKTNRPSLRRPVERQDSGSDKAEKVEKTASKPRAPVMFSTPPITRSASTREKRMSTGGKSSRRYSMEAHDMTPPPPRQDDAPEMTSKAAKLFGMDKGSSSKKRHRSRRVAMPEDAYVSMSGALGANDQVPAPEAPPKRERRRSRRMPDEDVMMMDTEDMPETPVKRPAAVSRKSGFANLFSGLMTPKSARVNVVDMEGDAYARRARRSDREGLDKANEESPRWREDGRREKRRHGDDEDEAHRLEAREARRAERRAARQRHEEERRDLEEREARRAERRRAHREREAGARVEREADEGLRRSGREEHRRSRHVDTEDEEAQRRRRHEERRAARAGEGDNGHRRRSSRRHAEHAGEQQQAYGQRKGDKTWPHSGTSSWVKEHSDAPPPPDDDEQAKREARRAKRRAKHHEEAVDEAEESRRRRRREERMRDRRMGGSDGSDERHHSRRNSGFLDATPRSSWWRKLTG